MIKRMKANLDLNVLDILIIFLKNVLLKERKKPFLKNPFPVKQSVDICLGVEETQDGLVHTTRITYGTIEEYCTKS